MNSQTDQLQTTLHEIQSLIETIPHKNQQYCPENGKIAEKTTEICCNYNFICYVHTWNSDRCIVSTDSTDLNAACYYFVIL